MAFVSVVLPAYKAAFLQQALDSILAQTFTDYELIIVDDDSPEDLERIVRQYDDPRIQYYRNPQNIGGRSLVAQWTNCIAYASGTYLVLAADDDYYHPEFLQTCVGLSQRYPHVDLIRTGAQQIDEHNQLIGIDGILPEYCSKYHYLFYWIQATAFTCMGNMMFKTEVLKKNGFIDFPCAFGSDTAIGVRMSEKGVASSPRMLFSFRISAIHLSSNINKLAEKLEANTLLFEWLKNLSYERPEDPLDQFMFEKTTWPVLYAKCTYDYYNLVIRHLPFYKFYEINKCRLLTRRDKFVMFLRFWKDQLIGHGG
ncbi:glycosyltransferase family 2 protein [Sphingobacterium suaedae]|uniref:Glycosyltransferase family 2 protein n=1 Tax=Sphingobacterium suaedae TaxID=1686402 RepID=A0ABW5KNS2_9SPHI